MAPLRPSHYVEGMQVVCNIVYNSSLSGFCRAKASFQDAKLRPMLCAPRMCQACRHITSVPGFSVAPCLAVLLGKTPPPKKEEDQCCSDSMKSAVVKLLQRNALLVACVSHFALVMEKKKCERPYLPCFVKGDVIVADWQSDHATSPHSGCSVVRLTGCASPVVGGRGARHA